MRGLPRRVGVLGGTFDPVHIGHLVAATWTRHHLDLDLVLLVVANEPWQKVGSRLVTPALDRLAVVEAAVADVSGIEATSIEIDRGGTTYTADTLAELRAQEPDCDLHLIVGSDVAVDLGSWVRIDEVRRAVTLVVVGRPGSAVGLRGLREQGWRAEHVAIPLLEVSSSDLRERVAAGAPIDALVPPAAVREIAERGLYAARR